MLESLIINDLYEGKLISQTRNSFVVKTDSVEDVLRSKEIHIKLAREKDGIIHYRGRATNVSGDEIYIGQLTMLKKVQRRKEKRIQYERPFLVNRIYISGELKHLNQNIPFISKDFSGIGVSLESPLKLPNEFSFFLDLSFVKKHLSVQVKILRREEIDNKHVYGCEFPFITIDESDAIRQYLYKHQLEEIRKLKGRN